MKDWNISGSMAFVEAGAGLERGMGRVRNYGVAERCENLSGVRLRDTRDVAAVDERMTRTAYAFVVGWLWV